MTRCERCGAEPVEGRFCTECGHPLSEPTVAISLDEGGDDWRSGTAERPAVDDRTAPQAPVPPSYSPPSPPPSPPPSAPPSSPPPTGAPGDGPRFPLFADEVSAGGRAPAEEPGTATVRTPAPPQLAPTPVEERRPRRWVPWAVVGVALVLIALFGAWFVTGPLGSSSDSRSGDAAASGKPGSGGSGSGDDLARGATATVPATAPPNQDTSGNMVRYDARQMLDGVPTTCWRMAGDATGGELTFDLGQQSRITTVGLINGYAKTAQGAGGSELDWYHGNRRVLTVEWSFDDGTTLTQQLGDTTQMQTIDLDHPVTTGTVHLKLVKVSAPGRGPAARDYTAISDVTLRGSAG